VDVCSHKNMGSRFQYVCRCVCVAFCMVAEEEKMLLFAVCASLSVSLTNKIVKRKKHSKSLHIQKKKKLGI